MQHDSQNSSELHLARNATKDLKMLQATGRKNITSNPLYCDKNCIFPVNKRYTGKHDRRAGTSEGWIITLIYVAMRSARIDCRTVDKEHCF